MSVCLTIRLIKYFVSCALALAVLTVTVPIPAWTLTYQAPWSGRPFEHVEASVAPQNLTLQDQAIIIAEEYGISTTTLFNLIASESNWNPKAVSKTGDYGLVQINLASHSDITKEQALDPIFSLQWAAQHIKEGQESIWVACNSWSFVKVQIPSLPPMAGIQPRDGPTKGSVAIFDYHGLKYVAYVTDLGGDSFGVLEADYKPCVIGSRRVSWDDPTLSGFANYAK